MTTIGYLRTSATTADGADGSLEHQRSIIDEYAESEGIKVARWVIERGMATAYPFDRRPAASDMLAGLKRNDRVLVSSFDRIAASAREGIRGLDAIRAKGARLHSVDLGGDVFDRERSPIVANLLAALAAGDGETKRLTQSDKRRRLKEEGLFLGGRVEFGFRVDDAGMLVEDAAQQRVLASMIELRKKGRSYREIQQAIASQPGGKLSYAGIRKILLERSRE